MLHPSALGFSPHPPVSVYGTGSYESIAAFLDGLGSEASLLLRFAPHHISASHEGFASHARLLACTGISVPGSSYPSVSPQFCSYEVQESLPVVHRLRLSASP